MHTYITSVNGKCMKPENQCYVLKLEPEPDPSLVPSILIYKMELNIFSPTELLLGIKLDRDHLKLSRVPNK